MKSLFFRSTLIIVSGALGLLKSIYPNGDRDFLISKIKLGASYFNDMDGDCNGEELNGYVGSGQLNIKEAILQSIDPELEVLNIVVLNETGIFIPGDTTELMITIQNNSGSSPINSITNYLSTEHLGVSLIQKDRNTDNVYLGYSSPKTPSRVYLYNLSNKSYL